jgi:hypothetical protein
MSSEPSVRVKLLNFLRELNVEDRGTLEADIVRYQTMNTYFLATMLSRITCDQLCDRFEDRYGTTLGLTERARVQRFLNYYCVYLNRV